MADGDLLWVTLPPNDIVELDPRELSSVQALTEVVTPYAGLGLTGEVKFRIRGVRTGLHIRTAGGRRY